MTIEEAERIVRVVYPDAFPFLGFGEAWSICNGTRTEQGNIRIPGVGYFELIEDAWTKAAEVVMQEQR